MAARAPPSEIRFRSRRVNSAACSCRRFPASWAARASTAAVMAAFCPSTPWHRSWEHMAWLGSPAGMVLHPDGYLVVCDMTKARTVMRVALCLRDVAARAVPMGVERLCSASR